MLFVKNYYEPVDDSKKLRLRARTGPDDGIVLVSLITSDSEKNADGKYTALFATIDDGLFKGIKKSIEYIGKKTDSLMKDEESVSADIFGDKVSEVSLYAKDAMVSLEPAPADDETWENIPVQLSTVNIVGEKPDFKKRYLRDIIAFVVNKSEVPAIVRCDERNIVGEPIFVSGSDYDVILVIPKWPAWGNLKFPAYMSVEIPVSKDSEKTVIGAIKLGCHTENGYSRNQVIEVDADEATKYLDESDAKRDQKAVEAGVDKLNNKFGGRKKKPQQNNNGNDQKKSAKKGNPSVKFPSMYKNSKGGGNTRPAQGQQKNYRKSGNR